MVAMKRQLEALEERLQSQITRLQHTGERDRETAVARLDAKVALVEAQQPQLDRRLAALSGNCKGLSDEMQEQIRRIDQMDSRCWDVQQQFEAELRARFGEAEQARKEADSSLRSLSAATDDAVGKLSAQLRRLESLVEGRLGYYDEVGQSIAALGERVQELEAARLHDLALRSVEHLVPRARAEQELQPAMLDGGAYGAAAAAALEARLAMVSAQAEQFDREFKDLQAEVQAQGERLRSLRTLTDSKEELYRQAKADRQDWETRAKELRELIQGLDRQRVAQREQLELLEKRTQRQGEAQEEMRVHLKHRFLERGVPLAEAVAPPLPAVDGAKVAEALRLTEEWDSRLCGVEKRLERFGMDMRSVRADAEFAPRVAALVETLSQVAPKVIDHEKVTKEVQQKVGDLEAKVDKSVQELQEKIAYWEAKAAVDKARAKVYGTVAARMSAFEGGGGGRAKPEADLMDWAPEGEGNDLNLPRLLGQHGAGCQASPGL